MPVFRLNVDGHASTGIACAVAAVLLRQTDGFAAFKMPNPLESVATVVLGAADEAAARRRLMRAASTLLGDLDALLAADGGPGDGGPPGEARESWPVQVDLAERAAADQISDEA